MITHDSQLFNLSYLDTLSRGESALHRIDARAKVLTFVFFICTVVSFGKYEISALLPFFLFPAVMIGIGGLPAGYLLRKIAILLPFALLIGIANPLFDREALVRLGPVGLSGGWISFFSILLRFSLTALAALVLIAITGFLGVCAALDRLGLPRIFTVQLLFVYRYLFVLTDEAGRMSRARELRSFGLQPMPLATFWSLAGCLLLRTIDRAQRIYLAMVSRGFTGRLPVRAPRRFGGTDAVFAAGWCAAFVFLRLVNLPQALGRIIEGLIA